MITLRRAAPADAIGIAAVHVAVWRTTYPGILPDEYLANLSVVRQARLYENMIVAGGGVFVATWADEKAGADAEATSPERIVGFTSVARARRSGLGDGEFETLYVLDDWHDQGVGRGLMRAGAAHLRAMQCRSAYLWVLRGNGSRWFYQRLGGLPVAEGTVHVAGGAVPQIAYAWNPIDRLIAASPAAS
jgi:GNAT superfamily N-acetyltransferase